MKLLRYAKPTDFYCPVNRWAWKALWFAVVKERWLTTETGVAYWLKKTAVPQIRKFGKPVSIVGDWLEAGLWWHGFHFLDRVRESAEARRVYQRTIEDLERAVEVNRKFNAKVKA